jgi:membrane protein
MSVKSIAKIGKCTVTEFGEDNVLRLSAALAYYAMFSIGPLLVIAVGLAGFAFGHQAVRSEIEGQLRAMLGENSAKMVESMMSAQKQGGGLITTIIGLVALLFGAAGVFGQLQDALNTIWGVKSKPGKGLLGLIRARFLSLSMVLGIGFLLLVSMAVSTALSALTKSMGSGLPQVLAHALNIVVSLGVVTLLFAMIFKYLPDIKVPLRKVWVGAILTALLFTAGKELLALYLGRASTASAYGAAGSVIIILMWVYYASVILFFGAEFTQVYAKQTGTQVVPSEFAEPVTQAERAEQGMASAPPRGPRRYDGALIKTPGMVVRKKPLQFAGMMLVAGFAGGTLLRFKLLRRAARVYTFIRTH